MGSISDHKPSLVITINDILDQLMAENKQLFTSLNQLIKHLIEIHVKYKTIIDSEDITRWDQLKKQLPDTICGHISRDVNKVDNECDARQKGPKVSTNERRVTRSIGQQPKQVVNQLDTKDINDCKTHDKDPKKPTKRYKKRSKCHTLPPKKFQCDHKDCPIRCRSAALLATHQRRHTETKPELEANRRLRQELLRCYDFAAKAYICPEIDCQTKPYKTYRRFRVHMVGIHSTNEIPCDHKECPKVFKTGFSMRTHYKLKHSTVEPYGCPHDGCDRRFVTQTFLNQHIVCHQTDRPFECDIKGCIKTFKSYQRLQTHKRIHNPKPWAKCRVDGCGQVFHNYNQLNKHRVNDHNIVIPKYHYPKGHYQSPCEWPGCDYVARCKSLLKLHQVIHTGQRDYVCDWPECGKRFGRPKNLRDHKNIHNNLKPYACHWPGCSYRCANSGNVSSHYKQVHLK